MAKNTGDGHRNGAVKSRSQVYNPGTGNFIKRDADTGKFMDVKSDGKPFKGVSIEKTAVAIKSNPSVRKSIAVKAEQAVIKYKNAKAS